MKKVLAALVVAVIVSLVPAGPAAAAEMEINISFPNILILYYNEEVNITLDQSDLITAPVGSEVAEGVLNETDTSVAGSADGAPFTAADALATFTVTLDNVWAARTLVGAAQTPNLAVTSATDVFSNGTDDLDIVSVTASSDSPVATATVSGAPVSMATGVNLTWASAGLGTAVVGNIAFDLDASGAFSAGVYTNTFILTLTASP